MRKIRYALNMWRLFPTYLIVKNKRIKHFSADLLRWKEILGYGSSSDFSFLMYALLQLKEIRNLIAYRLEKSNMKFARNVFTMLFPLYDTLFIHANEIDEGIFIQHGFSTIITARHIGRNCFINQQVTIGADKPGEDSPWIGDNVRICAGAIIVGDVKIGNNALIGAGAVVVKDVNDNEVVAGVPAKVIKIR